MAAYGALVSVMQIIDQILRHPHPPISLHEEHVESLTAHVTFLQEFLEGYNLRVSYTSEADPLESRIAEAAYSAEDVIESYIVDQIHAQSTTDDGGSISSTQFYQGLEKVIEEMDLIKTEVMEMKEKMKMGVQIIKQQSTTEAAASFRSGSSTNMVGLDEVLYEMLDKITGGERARQIIPIVGMGGLGKTTLARNIYAHQLVKERFDIHAWSTISQLHNARKILTEILGQVGLDKGVDLSDYELGEKLYRHLIGRRYLVVMDDMWSVEAWDVVRSFFPDNGNGSRVLVTTRQAHLASKFDYSDGLDMKFLDEATSWNLFSKTVFGDGIFPPELKDIGKKIVEGCRGLPLSIVVVGGLLLKSEATPENWKVVEENLSSVVNSDEDGSCLQILYTSYNNLPVHLKPCFLYWGVFDEDDCIQVYMLVPQMIAEGFIKSIEGKSLEEAAEEYLEELIDRNLVLVENRNHYGKLELCKIHDLLRDLCLREGEKDRFLCSLGQSKEICQGIISSQRRITTWSKEANSSSTVVLEESVEGAGASSLVRTLIGKFRAGTSSIFRFRLLRVYLVNYEEESSYKYYRKIFTRLLNIRFFFVEIDAEPLPKIPSYLWNLQTLILFNVVEDCVLDIWKMPLLRHVFISPALRLPNPPPDDVIVLESLHTLTGVRNLNLGEEVVKRIPSVSLLILEYEEEDEKGDHYCLNNLHRLNKLQRLNLKVTRGWDSTSMREVIFPHSLKRLVLGNTHLPWEEMASKIGCLPLLQVLELEDNAFIGSEWETVEDQFRSLKFLKIDNCYDLECWITDDYTHFPRLKHLVLGDLDMLREIPSSIGDIPTLESIILYDCGDSAVESARRIQEEQQEYGNDLLQIHLN